MTVEGVGGVEGVESLVVEALASWYADREDLFRAAGAVGERPADVVPSGPQDHLLVAFGRRPDWKAG